MRLNWAAMTLFEMIRPKCGKGQKERKMKPLRTLITPIVISAIAVTGLTSLPARAETSDLAKLLIGIGAIAVVANAIDKNREKASSSAPSSAQRVVTLPSAKKKAKRRHYALPSSCLRTYSAARGDRKLFSGNCLNRLDYKLAKLPNACAYTVQGHRRVLGKAYGPRCMAKHGFYTVHVRPERNTDHIVWNN